MCECGLVPVIRRMRAHLFAVGTDRESDRCREHNCSFPRTASDTDCFPTAGNWFCRGMHRGPDRSTRVIKTRSKPGNASFLAESEASLKFLDRLMT